MIFIEFDKSYVNLEKIEAIRKRESLVDKQKYFMEILTQDRFYAELFSDESERDKRFDEVMDILKHLVTEGL